MIAAIFIFILFIFAELLSVTGVLNRELFPAPHLLWFSFLENKEILFSAFINTLSSSCLGFLFSVIIGGSVSLLCLAVPLLRKILLPIALFFQTVPIIAIAPLLVIYLGFGRLTVVAASVIVAFFPIVAGFTTSLLATPKDYMELMQFYRATALQILFQVRIPAAFVGIYSSLKIAAGLSVIGVVAGEFVAGGGLGAIIDSARTQQRIDLVYLALLGLAITGLSLISFVDFLRSLLLKMRPFN